MYDHPRYARPRPQPDRVTYSVLVGAWLWLPASHFILPFLFSYLTKKARTKLVLSAGLSVSNLRFMLARKKAVPFLVLLRNPWNTTFFVVEL